MTLSTDTTARIDAQFAFLCEVDRLKSVERANTLMDGSRPENSAEHSWHACILAWCCQDMAAQKININHVLRMLVIHDLVEIHSGDHPIHLNHDETAIADSEARAAEKLFNLLPDDQAAQLHALREEFERTETPEAQYAKSIDYIAPILQSIGRNDPEELAVVAQNFAQGRVRHLLTWSPNLFEFAKALFDQTPLPRRQTDIWIFWKELDKLKSVLRASKVIGAGRYENSAEHSWHVMLLAMIFGDETSLKMLMFHDIVEIEAGDNPIHGAVSAEAKAAQATAELKAADRLFGLLPDELSLKARALWDKFEAAETASAKLGKAIDRTPTPLQNLAHNGGSWPDYKVTLEQIDQRVGTVIAPALPDVWHVLRARIQTWFDANSTV